MTPPLNASVVVPDTNRFTMFPIRYQKVWESYKRAQSLMWTAEEINLERDVVEWVEKLSHDERFFISHILAFFAGSDGIVNENLALRFIKDVENAEVRAFYATQMYVETVHSETYSVLIDTLIKDAAEKARLLNAINTIPSIKRKADWACRWINGADDRDRNAPFDQRLIAFAIVEGVFFSGSFCSIFWLRERGLMPGLCVSNELISRDEAEHTLFAVLLHGDLLKREDRMTQDDVHAMMKEAVALEVEFITESIPCAMIGMNADLMTTYVQFVADRLLTQLDYDRVFGAVNPFPFMDRTALEGKANFFERRDSSYAKPTYSASTAIKVDTTGVDF